LLLTEELLGLADLGALEMTNLSGDLVERGAEDGERGDVGGVAVALDDLRGDGDGGEAERGADGGFVLRLEVAKVPTAPESLPTRRSSAAVSKRVRLRCISEYQRRSLRPKVVGSAWTP